METRLTKIEIDMERLKHCEEKLAEYESKHATMKGEIGSLALKLDDLENRSRRNNLIIYGVTEESDEDAILLEKKVKDDILKQTLGIEVKTIERIHRIGNHRTSQGRPIILRLFDYSEKNKILSCCYKLKGTPLSVSEDFSKRVRDMRAHLWHSAANERAKGAKVKLSFDKLKVNDKVYIWDPVKNARTDISKKAGPPRNNRPTSSTHKTSTNKKNSN